MSPLIMKPMVLGSWVITNEQKCKRCRCPHYENGKCWMRPNRHGCPTPVRYIEECVYWGSYVDGPEGRVLKDQEVS